MLSRKVMPEKIRWTLTCLVSLFLLFSFVFRAAQAEEIVLEFAMWIVEPAEIEPTLEIIRTYEEMNPGVKINLIHQPWTGYHDKMMTLGIAGTAPDVMAISRVYLANFVEANLLLPLTKEIEPLLDEIIEIQSGMHEGEIYGIPVWGGPSLWMYNGGMFDLAGLQRPPEVYRQGDWNWDTVLDMARKLTYDRDGDGVIDVWAFESPSTIATDWVAKVHQFGAGCSRKTARSSHQRACGHRRTDCGPTRCISTRWRPWNQRAGVGLARGPWLSTCGGRPRR